MGSRYRSVLVSLAVVLAASVTGCADSADRSELPDRLRVSVLPGEDSLALHRRHDPLLAYLEERTGMAMELTIPRDYESLVERFIAGDFDLVWLGGLTYVRARQATAARALAMRDVDLEFRSVFLVPAASGARRIEDLAGARLSLGSASSTSGHLMPRHFLAQRGIAPERFFGSVRFEGSHDAAARAVQEGRADVAALNGEIARRMFRTGALDPDRVRVLWETPEYHDYLWALHPDVPESVDAALLDALLALDPDDPEMGRILDGYGAHGFVPAFEVDFDLVESVARDHGLLDGGRGS